MDGLTFWLRGGRAAPHMSNVTTKEKIIAAAIAEFAENGLAGARMDRLARAAGVNKAMIYYYFGSKEALFREVLKTKLITLISLQKQVVQSSGSLQQKLELVVHGLIELYRQDPSSLRILNHELLNNGHNMAHIAQEISPDQALPYHTGVAQLFENALADGQIRGENAMQVVFTHYLESLISGLLFPPRDNPFFTMP